MILGIIIGIFIGGCVGIVVMAIVQMAKEDDMRSQRIIESNRSRKGTRRDYYKSDVSAHDVYILVKQGYSFNQISKLLGLDWACVKQRYFDYIHDNPELLDVKK